MHPVHSLLIASTKSDEGTLVLPASGLPPVTLHLVQLIKDNKFVKLGDLLPEALQEVQFKKVTKDNKDKDKNSNKQKHLINSPLDWMAAFA